MCPIPGSCFMSENPCLTDRSRGAGEDISTCKINHTADSIGGIGGEMTVGGVMGTTGPLCRGVFYHGDIRKIGRS